MGGATMMRVTLDRRRLTVMALYVFLGGVAMTAGMAGLAERASAYVPTYEPTWAKSIDYDGGADDYLVDVLVGPDGTVWACGAGRSESRNTDFCLVRVPANGLRAYKYGWDGGLRLKDRAQALARGRDGAIYTVGMSTSRLGGADIRLIKWSAFGKVVWTRRLDGTGHGYDTGLDVVVDRSNNVTVCGWATGSAGDQNWAVASWSPLGKLRWRAGYDRAGGFDSAQALCVDSSGNVYVTGRATNADQNAVSVTIKYSRTGLRLWRRSYGGVGDGVAPDTAAIVRAPAGGVYVGGFMRRIDDPTEWTGPVVLHYTSAGIRSVIMGDVAAPAVAGLSALAVDSDGNIVTGGWQYDAGVRCPEVRLVSAAGVPLTMWSWPSGGPETRGQIYDVTADGAGNVYWAGTRGVLLIGRRSVSGAGGDWNGAWSAGEGVEPNACAVSGSALYVVGAHDTGAKGKNMFVLKYRP